MKFQWFIFRLHVFFVGKLVFALRATSMKSCTPNWETASPAKFITVLGPRWALGTAGVELVPFLRFLGSIETINRRQIHNLTLWFLTDIFPPYLMVDPGPNPSPATSPGCSAVSSPLWKKTKWSKGHGFEPTQLTILPEMTPLVQILQNDRFPKFFVFDPIFDALHQAITLPPAVDHGRHTL